MSSGATVSSDHSGPYVRAMIAERAYYKAERRGFAPGYEMDDWLEAEREQLESASVEPKVASTQKRKAAKAGARKKRAT